MGLDELITLAISSLVKNSGSNYLFIGQNCTILFQPNLDYTYTYSTSYNVPSVWAWAMNNIPIGIMQQTAKYCTTDTPEKTTCVQVYNDDTYKLSPAAAAVA